jgi:hypothetical protein
MTKFSPNLSLYDNDIRTATTLLEINETSFGKSSADMRQHLAELMNGRQANLLPQNPSEPPQRPITN